MTDKEANARAVITQLRAYSSRLDEIMNGIGDKRQLTPSEKTHLQNLLTSLKSDLNAEVKRGNTISDRKELNRFEEQYLHPAVCEASVAIRVKTNSHPIKSNWYSELYDAQIDIDFLLHQLEKQYPEP